MFKVCYYGQIGTIHVSNLTIRMDSCVSLRKSGEMLRKNLSCCFNSENMLDSHSDAENFAEIQLNVFATRFTKPAPKHKHVASTTYR